MRSVAAAAGATQAESPTTRCTMLREASVVDVSSAEPLEAPPALEACCAASASAGAAPLALATTPRSRLGLKCLLETIQTAGGLLGAPRCASQCTRTTLALA